MRMFTTIRVLTGCFAVVAAVSTAFANPNAKAEELFKQAKKLMAEQRYADACPKFEASFDLDPGIGGQLNIARCYEEWGKLGRAYRAYVDAEQQAKNAKDPRAGKIHELVVKLEPQVPRLLIRVPKTPEFEDVRVTVDGAPLSKSDLSKPYLVDPGPKQIEYALTSGVKQTLLIPLERGGIREVTLDVPREAREAREAKEARDTKEADAAKQRDKRDKIDKGRKPLQKNDKRPTNTEDLGKENVAAESAPIGSKQRVAGIITGSAGLVAIGASTALALAARNKYRTALASHCQGQKDMCDAQGLSETQSARSNANIATVVFSVGLAATIGGIVLYAIAPRGEGRERQSAFYVSPSVSPEGGGIALGGQF